MNIVLLHDQITPNPAADEKDVLVQMDAVGAALAELGHESKRLECTLDLNATGRRLRELRPHIVFNFVESLNGQGRLIHLAPALLESLGLAFTGCPSAAVFTTSNKIVAKQLLAGAYLTTPTWYGESDLQRGAGGPFEPGRYILKSVWEHASIGLDEDSIVDAADAPSLLEALRARTPRLGGEGFAELFVDGREFNLSMLAGQVLPAAEIVFEGYEPARPRMVGYRAKWEESSFEYQHTPRRFDFPEGDQPLLRHLVSMAEECWRVFSLRGYARVDFRVDESGSPWILEVNSNPCLSPDAGFAAAVARSGMTYAQAIERILDDTPPKPGC
jgi:D-alanine-D-alanine ligase